VLDLEDWVEIEYSLIHDIEAADLICGRRPKDDQHYLAWEERRPEELALLARVRAEIHQQARAKLEDVNPH